MPPHRRRRRELRPGSHQSGGSHLFYGSAPTNSATPEVAMNECIELAKRFGTTDSRHFVNGVLDKIAKQVVEQAEKL